ncbi:TPA: conjugal transfer pilus assembly protein TraU [Yersinia enterocolitica]
MGWRKWFVAVLFLLPGLAKADVMCEGRFVNPITDICWECIFPLSIGNIQIASGLAADTENPASPIQICPMGILYRVGLAIGYWEPFALTDVTLSPYCMVNLGGFNLNVGKVGTGMAGQSEKTAAGAMYHVHWYKYPLTYWLNIITSVGCLQSGDMDIGYLSELDPMWDDDTLSLIINPEALLFGNIIAQAACAVDAVAASWKPINALFWCAGAHGSMYPFTGFASDEFSQQQTSILLSERMAFKLHRQGLIMNSIGVDKAVCFEYPSPIIPKDRYRYQMVNMHADARMCHPFGRTVMSWETGHTTPVSRKNFGYLIWRKRNCVFL